MNTVKKPTAKRLRAWLRFLYECKVHPETLIEVSSDWRKFGHGLFLIGAVGGIVQSDKVDSFEAILLSIAGFALWIGAICLYQVALGKKKAKEKNGYINSRIRNACSRRNSRC